MLPRRFALVRHVDYTGVSGVGVVAYGVTFADGHVVLRWCSTHPATSMWSSIDDLLAIHGHGEATSIEWIDAPHGDLEEIAISSSRGRRARRRTTDPAGTPAAATADAPQPAPATRTTDPADIPVVATMDAPQSATELPVVQATADQPAVAAAHLTDPAGIPEPGATAANKPAAEPPVMQAAADQPAAKPAEAEPARDDLAVTSDPVRSVTDSVTDRTGSLQEADEQTAEDEPPSPRSTPAATPDRTDDLDTTQAWPAWADVPGGESVDPPAASRSERPAIRDVQHESPVSSPERPAVRDVRQESPPSSPEGDRWTEPRPVQRMEPSRDDPESTDPFASVLSEEPPEFPGRSNGHRHVDTITGLLDLPADLVSNSRAADSRSAAGTESGPPPADSRAEPAPRQLRRAGRHRREDL